MGTAKTASNLNYFQINRYLSISSEIEIGSKEWFKSIKKKGYKYVYRWINSDQHYMYFATNEARAREGAAELFSKEKGEYMKFSRKYYSEYIDVYSLDEIINE